MKPQNSEKSGVSVAPDHGLPNDYHEGQRVSVAGESAAPATMPFPPSWTLEESQKKLIHITITKTVMACAKLAGHESVFDSNWQIPRMEIETEATAEYFQQWINEIKAQERVR